MEINNIIKELGTIKLSINNLKKEYIKIPESNFKQKIKELINILDKIYEELFTNSNKLNQFKLYGDYYIPTITSMIKKYNNLKDKNTANTNDLLIKIEQTIDKLITHFNNKYNSLFEKELIDLDAEIKVLLHEIRSNNVN